jgi:hypothetical protein
VYHAWAHDDSDDGLIQCGTYNGASAEVTVNLGWETQFVLVKITNAAGDSWLLFDTMRGMAVGTDDKWLFANTSAAEGSVVDRIRPTATGFVLSNSADSRINSAGNTYIYLAIRRGPMRQPTSGTQVYACDLRNASAPAFTSNFPVDLVIETLRSGDNRRLYSRLTGATLLQANSTAAESSTGSGEFAFMAGWGTTTGASSDYIAWMLRRYPGVFDQVCYAGSGANKTEAHNLAVQPELWKVKCRSAAGNWVIGSTLLAATEKMLLNSTSGKSTDTTAWNSAYPTASEVSLGTLSDVNTNLATYTMYLYATLAGVSKVGLIACDGNAQQIDCEFAAGARYIEIFRSDGTSSRYVFDSTRGIVAGNDSYLALDSTAVEVTSTDYIDPYAAGFEITASAPWNVAGAHALYFAIA